MCLNLWTVLCFGSRIKKNLINKTFLDYNTALVIKAAEFLTRELSRTSGEDAIHDRALDKENWTSFDANAHSHRQATLELK